MESSISIINDISQYTCKDIAPSLYEGDGKDWTKVVDEALVPSAHYNWLSVIYQTAYFSGSSEYQNLPIIFYTKGEPIAIFPVAIIIQNGINKLVSAGGPIYEPLVIQRATDKQVKTIIDICEKIISDLSNALDIKVNEYQVTSTTKGMSVWGTSLLMNARVHRIGQQLDVDLSTASLDKIKSSFRKSYRPLINKGLKKWRVEVVEAGDSDTFWEYKQLHVAVAGRETRCIESWKVQLEMLNRKSAFLVTLRDEFNELVGAGLFVYNSQCGLYGSAAYRRDLFAEPLGHVVQYKAIEVMLLKGLKRYEIGYGFSELYGATEKECSITKFKSGFSNEVGVIMHLKK